MGAGERETLGRTSGASAELLACGDGGLKPPVEKRVKPVSQLYCRNFIDPSALFQLYRYMFIVPTVLKANFIILNFRMSQLYCSHLEEERDGQEGVGEYPGPCHARMRRFLQDLYFSDLYPPGFVFLG